MQLHRISAVVWRHLYHFRRNWDHLSDAIYWPVMDLLVWGLSAQWIQNNAAMQSNRLVLITLTGIVFWQIVWRSNYEVSVNLLEECWCGNVVNFFASPLKLSEWVAGVMTVGLLKAALGLGIGVLACYVLYALNILAVGHLLIPFLFGLMLFGWTLGLVATGLIVRYGRHIQTVAWSMGFVFAPLSAVYYPVDALPAWIQPAAYALPTTYIFEGMRHALGGGGLATGSLAISFALNLVYFILALIFFQRMFEKRRETGLHGLE